MRPLPPDDVFRRLAAIRDAVLADPAAVPPQGELARRAGMSRFHFLRRWKEAFGVTPHEDLTRLRIAHAKALLRGEHASVTDVCLEVGFSSLGTFSRTFSEIVGESPSSFRAHAKPIAVPNCFAMAWLRPASFGEAPAATGR